MVARSLLATPPLIVVAFYGAAFALMRIPESATPDFLRAAVNITLPWIFWIFGVIWAFALFSAAQPALQMGRGLIGNAFFVATFVLLAASIATDAASAHGSNSPFLTLIFVTCASAVVSMFFAASTLDTVEGGNGWPFKLSNVLTVFAVLFLPVGIWFLSGRIRKLLVATSAQL